MAVCSALAACGSSDNRSDDSHPTEPSGSTDTATHQDHHGHGTETSHATSSEHDADDAHDDDTDDDADTSDDQVVGLFPADDTICAQVDTTALGFEAGTDIDQSWLTEPLLADSCTITMGDIPGQEVSFYVGTSRASMKQLKDLRQAARIDAQNYGGPVKPLHGMPGYRSDTEGWTLSHGRLVGVDFYAVSGDTRFRPSRTIEQALQLATQALPSVPDAPVRATAPVCRSAGHAARKALGRPIAAARGMSDDDEFACTWFDRGDKRSVQVQAFDVRDATVPYDVTTLRDSVEQGEPMSGLGDEAAWFPAARVLQVQIGGLFVVVTSDDDAGPTKPLSQSKAQTLALFTAMEPDVRRAAEAMD